VKRCTGLVRVDQTVEQVAGMEITETTWLRCQLAAGHDGECRRNP